MSFLTGHFIFDGNVVHVDPDSDFHYYYFGGMGSVPQEYWIQKLENMTIRVIQTPFEGHVPKHFIPMTAHRNS